MTLNNIIVINIIMIRVHHKFSETDADPHNSNRGFFFAHVGWLMMHKHPEVVRKGKMLNLDDIMEDPVVRFHQRYVHNINVLLIPLFIYFNLFQFIHNF